MALKPNYRFERAERARAKAAKKEKRAERRRQRAAEGHAEETDRPEAEASVPEESDDSKA